MKPQGRVPSADEASPRSTSHDKTGRTAKATAEAMTIAVGSYAPHGLGRSTAAPASAPRAANGPPVRIGVTTEHHPPAGHSVVVETLQLIHERHRI
jgi:hypothetical protein